MSELCFSGWKVPKEEADPWWTPLGAYQFQPRYMAIYEQMNNAYRMKGNNEYRKRARKGAMQYDAKKVVSKYWLPVIKQLEDKLNG